MRVRPGEVEQNRIEWEHAAREQLGHVGEEDRHVIGAALIHCDPRVAADEQGAMAEGGRHLRLQVRGRSLDVEVDEADIAELARSSRERLQQHRRRCRAAMDEDLLAGADACNGLIGADDSHESSVGRAGRRVACHSVPTISPFSPDGSASVRSTIGTS